MRKTGVEEAHRWLTQAKEDLKWARHLADQGGYHIACFLAQQVAEKALKALLYGYGETLVLGNSVGVLSQKAATYRPELMGRIDDWTTLDTYYIPTRYPNGLPDGIPAKAYNQKTAREAVSLADEVVVAAEKAISEL